MTHKEVVKWLESLKKEIGKAENRTLWHYAESIDMAIDELEAPTESTNTPTNTPTEFLISRYDAKDKAKEIMYSILDDTDYNNVESMAHACLMMKIKILKMFDALPSAEPKTGEWIEVEKNEYEGFSIVNMRCNQCGRYAYLVLPKGTKCVYDYCPWCKADMRGDEE